LWRAWETCRPSIRPLLGVDLRFPLVAAWRRVDAPPTVRSFLDVLGEVAGTAQLGA
jgi:hypothetical protein